MAIGEAGSLFTNSPTENAPITVTFAEALTDPVIALTGSQNGGNGYVLRVTDVALDGDGNATGFTFIIEEWEYLDGPHPAFETINWLAVEKGVHTLPDGRVIEAGTTTATGANSTVTLTGGFTAPPVVLTSVMSENDTTTVDSDPWNITSNSFTVSLQEEEAEDDIHAPETVGYIAIEPGAGALTQNGVDENTDIIGLGGTFTDPVTLAETQTLNGGDPGSIMIDGGNGSTNVGLFFQEEQSADDETGHVNETVGIVTFEQGLILCFTAGTTISTPHGPRPVEDLAPGDAVLTRDNGVQTLRWTCASVLPQADLIATPDLAPVAIPKDAFGPGLPSVETRVSPQHRLLLADHRAELLFGSNEVLAPAKALFAPCAPEAGAHYVHLLFDRHEIVFANDLPMESFHPGDMAKSALSAPARNELFALFPDLRTAPRAWGPTARLALRRREAQLLAA
jgi:hypothetical protein